MRNATVITASAVIAVVIATLYYNYIAASVSLYGAQGPMIIELPNVF